MGGLAVVFLKRSSRVSVGSAESVKFSYSFAYLGVLVFPFPQLDWGLARKISLPLLHLQTPLVIWTCYLEAKQGCAMLPEYY